MLRATCCAVLVSCARLPTRAPKPAYLAVSIETASNLVDRLNGQRALLGLPPLEERVDLDWMAQWRSDDQAIRQYYSHHIPAGSADPVCARSGAYVPGCPDQGSYAAAVMQTLGFPYTRYAEIIDAQWCNWNQGSGCLVGLPENQIAVAAWMASPDHHAIIVDPAYRYAGAGIADGPDGRKFSVELAA